MSGKMNDTIKSMLNQRYILVDDKIRVYPNTPAESILKELSWSYIKHKILVEHKCFLCDAALIGEGGVWAVHNYCPNHGCLTGDCCIEGDVHGFLLEAKRLCDELVIKINYG
jgi:hypothetical protein